MAITIRLGGKNITVEENTLDRLVRYVDPVRARERMRARVQLAAAGGYTGGRRD